ncbi:MAG: PD40 domain-containing protein [Armatimonadetes bacterium]|nr:PD40 domain-containing protein [Armatimonadota bacterium]
MIVCPSIALVLALDAQPILKDPDIHGDKMTFSCEGDIWLGDLTTGKAVRLTKDEGKEDAPCFSPDGTMIAFHGEYDGLRGAYVIPVEGGPPRRVSFASEFRSVTGWTPDGKNVVFRKFGTPTNYEYWLAPVGRGVFKKIPLEFSSHLWFGHDSDHYVFTRFNRWSSNWFRYIGGMQNQIWMYDGTKFKQITDQKGTNEYPVWCGDNIYFANEQDAKFTLMSVPASGGKPKVVAGPYDVEIRELSTDGHKVVYQRGTSLDCFDPETEKVSSPTFTLDSDLAHTRPFLTDARTGYSDSSLSPNAKRVLVETRGQIVSLPVGEGEARVWKAKPGARLRIPEMSPDAKTVAYVSDQSGEYQIWTANADGSGEKMLTKFAPCQIKSLRWSPNGKWIVAYTSEMKLRAVDVATGSDKEVDHFSSTWYGPVVSFSPDSRFITFARNLEHTTVDQVEVYDLNAGELHVIGDGIADDFAPSFSSDGKYIVFLSRRVLAVNNDPILNQLNLGPTTVPCLYPLQAGFESPFGLKDPDEDQAKPADKPADKPEELTKVDFDGMAGRRIEVPMPAGTFTQTAMVKDRILLLGEGSVSTFDMGSKKTGVLTQATGFELSKDGSKVLVGQGGNLRVIDTTANDVPVATGSVSWGALKLQIDPKSEWKQMFWDAWRLLRDYFYIANMHGLDWKLIGDKYSAFLPSVRSRSELDDLLRWMQAEIGSSHEYLSPGDEQDNKQRLAPAYLGINLEAADGGLRIAKIVRGDGFRTTERSPLADPSLKVTEGMYILKIGGVSVASEIELYDRLLGRAGQTVGVTVNDKPSAEGARTVFVKPVGSENRMRYLDWVASNRRYVDKASGGRVGYLHLAAMTDQDMQDFVKQYFPQRGREALIVDTRYNNGGYIQTFVNNILGEKLSGYFNMRNSKEPWSRQNDAFIGPRCCLINEFAISCGEEFPHRFRDMNNGPLIGRRTMGGEVGSSPGWPLADGGQVFVPDYGMFTMKDGWVIEGAGVSPDIDVPSDPNAFVAGRDPQLDAGVKAMLDALKKNPVVWPKQPADRVRVGGKS